MIINKKYKIFNLQNKNFYYGKPMIVGEMSCNHGGSIKNAKKIIDAASKIGLDAIKLQTFTPDTITLNSFKKDFKLNHVTNKTWKKYGNYYSIYKDAHTPWAWHSELFEYAKKKKIIIFSSPFDATAVDLLEKINCPIYKVASPEINHIPLIDRISKTKKPIIFSTGLANITDIDLAIKTFRKESKESIILLKCNSSYPANELDSNLLNLNYFSDKYKNIFVGLSDHTTTDLNAIIATSLGAVMIEKHFTIKSIGKTLDSFFSYNEFKMKKYILNIDKTCKILGYYDLRISDNSKKNLKSKRSIYASKKIKKGEKFSINNIRVVRPGLGLHPKYFRFLIGKKSRYNINEASRIKLSYVEN
jgi:pseudaminic acid synthase